jgi:hypothetical protein
MGKKRTLPLVCLIPAAATLLIMAAWLAPASPAHGAPTGQSTPTPTVAAPPCAPFAEFDPGSFSDPTNIDNEWFPLVPGRKLVLKGLADGRHHRVVFIATDLTKVINGVRTRVMWNRDYQSGRLVESELAFFAQDDNGNVWNLGKYPEEYENGQFTGAANTWIAGIADAEGGLHMPGEPEVGGPEYLQGIAPEIDFLDCEKVIAKDEGDALCVPLDCYDHILITEERSPLDAGSGHQRKYHAKDVGIVQITSVEDPEGETLALIKDAELRENEKIWARQKAFSLEERAYEISEVYKDTPPAERLLDPPAPTPGPTPEPSEPTPELEPTPEPSEPPPEPSDPALQAAALAPTPTPIVAPLRTVPAVALAAFQAPRRAPRSGGGFQSILPSILPSGGGLPGVVSSPIGWIPLGLGLVLLAAYGRSYLHLGARGESQKAKALVPRNNPGLAPGTIASTRREALERQERAYVRSNTYPMPRAKRQPRDD